MTPYLLTLFITTVTCSYYKLPFWLLSIFWFFTPFIFYKLDFITNTQGIITLFLLLNIIVIGNVKHIRRLFITTPAVRLFTGNNRINWKRFQQIDDGWLVSPYERALYNGTPDFSKSPQTNSQASARAKAWVDQLLANKDVNVQNLRAQLDIKDLIGLTIQQTHSGRGFSQADLTHILTRLAQVDPLLSALVGIINTESVTSLLQAHGSREQKNNYLPAFAKGEKQPFLNTTFLYELLENGKSSIEGRIDIESHQHNNLHGIRLSFTDIIMLGSEKSSVFYLAVNLTDFANELSERTQLGTALCMFDTQKDNITIKRGNDAYKGLFQYYSCSAKDIFIPLNQIIGGFDQAGQGIKHMYQMQSRAASLWPAAVSLAIHDSATYIAWFFAQIKKQNSRPLLGYKLVQKQLNRQFSHRQRLLNIQQMALTHEPETLMSYSNILFKNTIFDVSLNQLAWLRTVLGSHAHQIKSENNLNQYFRVKHLSMELDGNSHEINQLPLMKKVALSAHPWYSQEIHTLSQPHVDNKKLDFLLFKHIGFMAHNMAKVWVFAFRSSWLGRQIWRRSKHHNLVRRMSATHALIADLALVKWSIKAENNTEFTGFLAHCNQQLLMQLALLKQYLNEDHDPNLRFVLKQSLRDSFFLSQQAINQCVNSAFSRFSSLALKIMIFPFGKPFHAASFSTQNNETLVDPEAIQGLSKTHSILARIAQAAEQLDAAKNIENAVTNATGVAVTTKKHQVLIDRTLAAGIISVEQAEQIRTAYNAIHELELINHFGNNDENPKKT